jgi:hypothetical protein
MKQTVLAILLFLPGLLIAQDQPCFSITPGNGNGLRFWNNDLYKIHMGSSSEYLYGPVIGYSIKTNMASEAGWGWSWGVYGQVPVAALNNLGQMRIAGMFDAGGQAMALRLRSGNGYVGTEKSQINFSYDGGIGYSHSIRTRHNATVTSGNALDFYVWQPGDAVDSQGSKHVMSLDAGNVGIGTTAPTHKLDVHAAEGQWKARFQGPDGYIIIGPANSSWAHIYTDRPAFLFNQPVYSFPGSFSSFSTSDLTLQTHGTVRMTVLNSNGNIGVGTSAPDQKLTVKGKIHSEEVIVDLSVPAPDYVFEQDYSLTPLDEVQAYIAQHKHLPEVPSAKEMEKDGVKVGEMEMILLKKIEELTLYMIETNKELKLLREENKVLHAGNDLQNEKIKQLEQKILKTNE